MDWVSLMICSFSNLKVFKSKILVLHLDFYHILSSNYESVHLPLLQALPCDNKNRIYNIAACQRWIARKLDIDAKICAEIIFGSLNETRESFPQVFLFDVVRDTIQLSKACPKGK